jgi:hypothetical protein
MPSIASFFAGLGNVGQQPARPQPARPTFETAPIEPVRGGVDIQLSPQARQALEAFRPTAPAPISPVQPATPAPRRLDLRV